MEKAEWFAVDWGTSNLRVWAMGAGGRVISQETSDKGMGVLRPDEFEPALLELIGDFLGEDPAEVLCCGMVGARQGWVEAPYAVVPRRPTGIDNTLEVQVNDPRIMVKILPGVMQKTPADVIRGEETQIAGFVAKNRDFTGTICLPGTHTKWVRIRRGEIVCFSTFMTGELFALTSQQSVLQHSVGGKEWSRTAFEEAVFEVIHTPARFAQSLFGIRAEGLLGDPKPGVARARLSGLLIGLELAGSVAYWKDQDVVLIGAPELTALYARALDQVEVPNRAFSGDEMTLAGIKAAFKALKET